MDDRKPDPYWLTTIQAAEYIQLHPGTLRTWRCKNKGPESIKLPNGTIRYSKKNLERWVRSGFNDDPS